jgi:hypothetical protein
LFERVKGACPDDFEARRGAGALYFRGFRAAPFRRPFAHRFAHVLQRTPAAART